MANIYIEKKKEKQKNNIVIKWVDKYNGWLFFFSPKKCATVKKNKHPVYIPFYLKR